MSFLDKYIESNSEPKGIPNLLMNAPIVGSNGLGQVGLELELEGRRLPTAGHLERIVAPTTKAMWGAHPDGSLRGENQEYVLSTPCNVDEAEGMLNGLYAKFTELNTALNISNRCSTHVHVNMADRKINQLTAIVALWTTYEEVLINWCGEERKSNHFCLSTKDSTSLIQRWNSFLTHGRFDFPEGMKYCALNVRPLYTFGSFEFRCMSATEDQTRLLDWTKFVAGLCDFASQEFQDPRDMASALSERGTIELFADICRMAGTSPKFFDSILHHPENGNFEAKIMEGFRRAQQLALGHPWDEWLPEINKVYVPSPFGTKQKTKQPIFRVEDLDDGPRRAQETFHRLGAQRAQIRVNNEDILREAEAEGIREAAARFRDFVQAEQGNPAREAHVLGGRGPEPAPPPPVPQVDPAWPPRWAVEIPNERNEEG